MNTCDVKKNAQKRRNLKAVFKVLCSLHAVDLKINLCQNLPDTVLKQNMKPSVEVVRLWVDLWEVPPPDKRVGVRPHGEAEHAVELWTKAEFRQICR